MALLGSVDRRNTAEHLIVHRVCDPNIIHTHLEHLSFIQSMEYGLPPKFPVIKVVDACPNRKAQGEVCH